MISLLTMLALAMPSVNLETRVNLASSEPAYRLETATPTAADVRAKLKASGKAMWIEGQQITFALEDAKATGAIVCCGFQERLVARGEGVYSLTIWVRDINQMVISYGVLPLYNNAEFPEFPREPLPIWRGPQAPAASPRVDALRGKRLEEKLISTSLKAERGISVYLPPNHDPAAGTRVIYMADGQSVEGYAPMLEAAILAGRVPPTVLIGIHNSDQRYEEYVTGGAPYKAHEAFVMSEVLPWAERTFGVSKNRASRFLMGVSNGADWTLKMSASYGDTFGGVIAMSPLHGLGEPRWTPSTTPAYYLEAGQFEAPILENALSVGRNLETYKAVSTLDVRVGGHDGVIWEDVFVGALEWLVKNVK